MQGIDDTLNSILEGLSDQNYAESFDYYRIWFDIGHAYHGIPSNRIFDTIWKNRGMNSNIDFTRVQFIHSADLILRFACDAESDHILARHSSRLQSRLGTRALQEFFGNGMEVVRGYKSPDYVVVNLIAHWANLGYVEETAIRNHILQSLISHPTLHDSQAYSLIILFKLAGATFEAYVDPAVVDRCFKLLKGHSFTSPYPSYYDQYADDIRQRRELVEEVIILRERGWEGLPPPPIFTTGKPKPVGAKQRDPAATPIATSIGLPNRDPEPQSPPLEPQIPQSPPLGTVAIPETDATPASPVTQSPSISIATLSDFTIADASDEESQIDSTISDTSDDELPIDLTTVAQHKTFYLEDGNVEVLCGSTLFRVHTSVLSFHSPALRRMFAQANLATAESPNGCPRITSSDTAADFATLLKMIYLPGFPERNKVPDFTTFSSLLRISAKYEMPAIRSQILEVVRDAYPETFEGLGSSKPLGESVFSGRTPHPNEVLNLFVQQKLTSALPMAYYMATRRGLNSLMDRHLPRNAMLPPEVLQSAIGGLITLREAELNETHNLIFGLKESRPCSSPNCPSRTPSGPAALAAYHKVFDRIAGSSQLGGTKVLQVPEFYEDLDGEPRCVGPGICGSCVERWESGHAELRKKTWAALPGVFGLKD